MLPLPSNVIGGDRFMRIRRVTSTAVLLMNASGVLGTVARRRAFAAIADVPALQRAYDRKRTTVLSSVVLDGPDDPALHAALGFARNRRKSYAMLCRAANCCWRTLPARRLTREP